MNTQTTEQQSTHLSRTDKSQLAYQKLDKAFGGVGENISTRGVDDVTIQNICDAKTHEEVREIWGKYVHGKVTTQFSSRTEDILQ